MSTNYYARTMDMPEDHEGLHIGKSSVGWDFLWRGHKKLNLTSRALWEKYLNNKDISIVSEMGIVYDLTGFLDEVVNPRDGRKRIKHAHYWLRFDRNMHQTWMFDEEWVDDEGYPFCGSEFC